ncbi:uncharacterized protein LOC100368020 isoform X2 [Saccoglossus kowalevskii]
MATSNEDRAAVLDKIDEDFLTCSICQERITNPKILDCLHSFCARCLKDYAAKNPIFKANPSCPVCRMSFRLPESGVDGHKNIDIDNAAKTTKDAILSQISVAEERISQCQYSLNRAEQTGQELESCRVKAKKDIDERAKNLIHLLTEQIELHAENLKREVDERAAVKRIVIDKYKKEMEEQIDRASSTCDYSGKVLSYGNNTEVLLMEKQVCGKLNSVTKESISKLPTTGKMKLENYNMVPVIKYADIGRVVWTMSGPLLAAEMTEGDRVERGSDWIWQNQDGGAGCKGTVLSKPNKGHWVKVKWDKGGENIYRMGASGHYDLERADDRDKRLNLDQVSKTSSSWLNWIGL